MADRPLLAVGLMVGTSLDGIDAALVAFDADLRSAVVRAHRVDPLRHADAATLRAIAADRAVTASRLSALAFAVVDDHEAAVRAVCADAGIEPRSLDWVGAHGVTLAHVPGPERGHGWQLLPGGALAARLGCPVAYDFRVADIALGGQGAPLAPVADVRLRSAPDEDRVILNLGGIANLTCIGAAGATVVAADVGPANMPLDELARRHDPAGPGHDRDGERAARGRVHEGLLQTLLVQDWVRAPLPRSFGREQFGAAWVDVLEDAFPDLGLDDRLATVVALESRAVADLLDMIGDGWRRAPDVPLRVYVTGGGRHNLAVLRSLATHLPAATVDGIEALGDHADAKEAVDFALLGGLCVSRRAAGAWRTTGAREDVVLGSVAWGKRDDD